MSETMEEIKANREEELAKAGDLEAIERMERRDAAEQRRSEEAIERVLSKHMAGELNKYLSSTLCVDTETNVRVDAQGAIHATFYATEKMSDIVVRELERIEEENGYAMDLEVCPPSPMVFVNRRSGYYATFTRKKEDPDADE